MDLTDKQVKNNKYTIKYFGNIGCSNEICAEINIPMFIKKNKILTILVLLFLVFLIIYTTNKKTISSEDALNDFKYLVTTIEENFPGTYHIDYVKEDKLEKSYKNIIQEISSNKNIELYHFYTLINKYLSNYNSENGPLAHLYLLREEDINYLRDIKPIILKCACNFDLNEEIWETYRYISARESLFNTYFFKNSKVIENNLGITETANFILLTVKSFDQRLKENDFKRMENFVNEKNRNKDLIIDLSSCIGGSDYYWIDNFIKPNMFPKTRMTSDNDRALFLDGNYVKPYIDYFRKSPEYIVRNFDESKINERTNFENFKYLVTMIKGKYDIRFTPKNKMFGGNIYVYYGKNTSSSAESFIEFLKFNKAATLCGNNSKGDSPFIEPLYIKLANSDFIIKFQVDYKIDIDNKPIWEKGVEPDIYVNSTNELMNIIKNNKNK